MPSEDAGEPTDFLQSLLKWLTNLFGHGAPFGPDLPNKDDSQLPQGDNFTIQPVENQSDVAPVENLTTADQTTSGGSTSSGGGADSTVVTTDLPPTEPAANTETSDTTSTSSSRDGPVIKKNETVKPVVTLKPNVTTKNVSAAALPVPKQLTFLDNIKTLLFNYISYILIGFILLIILIIIIVVIVKKSSKPKKVKSRRK